jgi:hypothetical protein
LCTVVPVIRRNFDVSENKAFGSALSKGRLRGTQRVLELHDAILDRARRAIACWSMAGWRLGVVKDIWVKIAKMTWEEAWRWGEESREKDPVTV